MEISSTRGDRPKLRKALGQLLEDQLRARGINLHILTGICAGIHRPDGATGLPVPVDAADG